jgi:polygalacturonase
MNAINIRRRLLLSGAVGALALRPSYTAQADTTFTNFSFAATGAPTARTMPDRLSDVINIKDWGAIGNHKNNDTSAIQGAVDYAISRGGGKVFFPPGHYVIDRPLVVGSSNDTGVH